MTLSLHYIANDTGITNRLKPFIARGRRYAPTLTKLYYSSDLENWQIALSWNLSSNASITLDDDATGFLLVDISSNVVQLKHYSIATDGSVSLDSSSSLTGCYITDSQTSITGMVYLAAPWLTQYAQRKTVDGIMVGMSVYLKKVGNPTGEVVFSIKKSSNDTVYVSKTVSATNIPSGEGWYEVFFDTPTYVSDDVRVSIQYGYGSTQNYFNVYYAGNVVDGVFSQKGTSWVDDPTKDFTYKLYYLPPIRSASIERYNDEWHLVASSSNQMIYHTHTDDEDGMTGWGALTSINAFDSPYVRTAAMGEYLVYFGYDNASGSRHISYGIYDGESWSDDKISVSPSGGADKMDLAASDGFAVLVYSMNYYRVLTETDISDENQFKTYCETLATSPAAHPIEDDFFAAGVYDNAGLERYIDLEYVGTTPFNILYLRNIISSGKMFAYKMLFCATKTDGLYYFEIDYNYSRKGLYLGLSNPLNEGSGGYKLSVGLTAQEEIEALKRFIEADGRFAEFKGRIYSEWVGAPEAPYAFVRVIGGNYSRGGIGFQGAEDAIELSFVWQDVDKVLQKRALDALDAFRNMLVEKPRLNDTQYVDDVRLIGWKLEEGRGKTYYETKLVCSLKIRTSKVVM